MPNSETSRRLQAKGWQQTPAELRALENCFP